MRAMLSCATAGQGAAGGALFNKTNMPGVLS